MLGLRPSPPRFSADRLLAVGGSLAIHGLAVAAVITTLAGGAVKESPSPPTIALTLEWAAAPNAATAQSNMAAATTSESTASASEAAPPMSEPVTGAAEARVETTVIPTEATMPETTASDAIEPPQTPPPARKPKTVAAAKPQPAAAPHRNETTEDERQATSTTVMNSASPRGDGTTDIATADAPTGDVSDARSAAAPARQTGEPTAWSITSRIPPSYPMSARRRGIEGEVELRVEVDSQGRPRLVTIARSSGDRQLDSAAARAVEQWRFAVAAPMAIEIPVQFRLNAGDLAASQP